MDSKESVEAHASEFQDSDLPKANGGSVDSKNSPFMTRGGMFGGRGELHKKFNGGDSATHTNARPEDLEARLRVAEKEVARLNAKLLQEQSRGVSGERLDFVDCDILEIMQQKEDLQMREVGSWIHKSQDLAYEVSESMDVVVVEVEGLVGRIHHLEAKCLKAEEALGDKDALLAESRAALEREKSARVAAERRCEKFEEELEALVADRTRAHDQYVKEKEASLKDRQATERRLRGEIKDLNDLLWEMGQGSQVPPVVVTSEPKAETKLSSQASEELTQVTIEADEATNDTDQATDEKKDAAQPDEKK